MPAAQNRKAKGLVGGWPESAVLLAAASELMRKGFWQAAPYILQQIMGMTVSHEVEAGACIVPVVPTDPPAEADEELDQSLQFLGGGEESR